MAEEPQENFPTPDSISEPVDSLEADEGREPPEDSVQANINSSSRALEGGDFRTVSTNASTEYIASSERVPTAANTERTSLTSCSITPMLAVSKELHLPGSSSSAFRPFITRTCRVSANEASDDRLSQQTEQPVTSTPVMRRAERLTLPVTSTDFSFLQRSTPLESPSHPVPFTENQVEENEDGRTTASAPPCTPAPEPHIQVQSPFRNNRQIKRIDLLDMSRSRQSDRAENARRDGRLAPSPRKKDEVLRNSGYMFPPARAFGSGAGMRLNSLQSSTIPGQLSPSDRGVNNMSSTNSPNVDVVSVDDQQDASKCMFSIQFHDFAPAAQMMKCSLCGFVTNNQKFYRRHRRLHTRQFQPNQIHCSACDYTTTQIRKMREHTASHHHHHHQLSHPNTISNTNQSFNPAPIPEATLRPTLQGHMLMASGSIYEPESTRPVTLPVGASATTAISGAPTLGLHTFIPAHQNTIQVNNEAGLQHPPRGSAMLGNYAGQQQQVASYIGSVVSNLMSPAQTLPSSSVTSSGLYMHSSRNPPQESHTALLSSNLPLLQDSYSYQPYWNNNSSNNSGSALGSSRAVARGSLLKVKTEPRPALIAQLSHRLTDMPSSTQQERVNPSPRRQSDTLDSESGMDVSSDDHLSSPQPDIAGSRAEARNSTETNHAETVPQGEGSSMESQCSLPFIKIEFPSHSDSCAWLPRPDCSRSERGVQCEIFSNSHPHASRTQSETVSSAGGSVLETRCNFCGVTFDDEVLYSIHIGCHSHTDPFVCNVCGKQCHNKYGFYSHIMRGHHARPNT